MLGVVSVGIAAFRDRLLALVLLALLLAALIQIPDVELEDAPVDVGIPPVRRAQTVLAPDEDDDV